MPIALNNYDNVQDLYDIDAKERNAGCPRMNHRKIAAPHTIGTDRAESEVPTAKLRVAFVLVPEFTLTAFASFVDALRLAADESDRSRPVDASWTLLGEDLKPVKSSCGVEVRPWQTFADPADFDYIVVAGGLLRSSQRLGATTVEFLRRAARQNVPLVGICTGSFVLARAGLMQGFKCCVLWLHLDDFVREFPDVRVTADQLYVADGQRLTCAGGTSVTHLAAYIIERHLGIAPAIKCLRILVEDAPLPAAAPQPLADTFVTVEHPRVRKAIRLMEQGLGWSVSIADVAADLHMSVRQLERDFHEALERSPQTVLLELRVSHVKWLLGSTHLAISEIAQRCGFSDTAHLSRVFRRSVGCTPSAFRNDTYGNRHRPAVAAHR